MSEYVVKYVSTRLSTQDKNGYYWNGKRSNFSCPKIFVKCKYYDDVKVFETEKDAKAAMAELRLGAGYCRVVERD